MFDYTHQNKAYGDMLLKVFDPKRNGIADSFADMFKAISQDAGDKVASEKENEISTVKSSHRHLAMSNIAYSSPVSPFLGPNRKGNCSFIDATMLS